MTKITNVKMLDKIQALVHRYQMASQEAENCCGQTTILQQFQCALNETEKKLVASEEKNAVLQERICYLERENDTLSGIIFRKQNKTRVWTEDAEIIYFESSKCSSSASITKKSWKPKPKNKRTNEDHQENVNSPTVICSSNETSSSMTAAKRVDENAQKKKQFFMFEKTDYMENMLGALQNMANLMDGPMEIDTRESEQIEKADLGTNANANIADPDGNSSVKIAHSEVDDRPIKGGPTSSCSPVGTTPTEVDSGYVEKDNMDIDDTGAGADCTSPTPPLAVQIVEGFQQYFMNCIEPIKLNHYGVDDAIETFFLYTPINPVELAHVDERMMEAIKQTLRQSAKAILKVKGIAKKDDKLKAANNE